jgi:hypothetical protein
MKPAHSILLFGHQPDLLATHHWVLESRGYGVSTAGSLTEMASLPKTSPIRLVLLCPQLTPAERTAAVAFAATRWPGIVARTLPQPSRVPTGILGRLMHTSDGPTDLVTTVRMLLQEEPAAPPKPSRRSKAA